MSESARRDDYGVLIDLWLLIAAFKATNSPTLGKSIEWCQLADFGYRRTSQPAYLNPVSHSLRKTPGRMSGSQYKNEHHKTNPFDPNQYRGFLAVFGGVPSLERPDIAVTCRNYSPVHWP
jgi:hypothetical protein